jgi:hypothetical protein
MKTIDFAGTKETVYGLFSLVLSFYTYSPLFRTSRLAKGKAPGEYFGESQVYSSY